MHSIKYYNLCEWFIENNNVNYVTSNNNVNYVISKINELKTIEEDKINLINLVKILLINLRLDLVNFLDIRNDFLVNTKIGLIMILSLTATMV